MISWAVYEPTDVPGPSMQPKTGLPLNVPGGVRVVAYATRPTGSRPSPNVVEIGGGQYGFEPLPGDREAGVAYLVQNGGGFPEYVAGAVCDASTPFEVWVLTNEDGSLWTGPPASVVSWNGPPSAPAVVAVLPHLQTVTPIPSQLVAGPVSFVASSPAGALPEFFHSRLALPEVSAPTFVPPVVPNVGFVCDMSDAIALLGTGTYSVKRRGPTAYLNGRRVPPSVTTFTVSGTLVPLTALEISRLPEGLVDGERWHLFTTTQLVSAQGGAEPDSITIDGLDYAVEKVERWAEAGNFWKAMLMRPSR